MSKKNKKTNDNFYKKMFIATLITSVIIITALFLYSNMLAQDKTLLMSAAATSHNFFEINDQALGMMFTEQALVPCPEETTEGFCLYLEQELFGQYINFTYESMEYFYRDLNAFLD